MRVLSLRRDRGAGELPPHCEWCVPLHRVAQCRPGQRCRCKNGYPSNLVSFHLRFTSLDGIIGPACDRRCGHQIHDFCDAIDLSCCDGFDADIAICNYFEEFPIGIVIDDRKCTFRGVLLHVSGWVVVKSVSTAWTRKNGCHTDMLEINLPAAPTLPCYESAKLRLKIRRCLLSSVGSTFGSQSHA
jgi:hypothetical protein